MGLEGEVFLPVPHNQASHSSSSNRGPWQTPAIQRAACSLSDKAQLSALGCWDGRRPSQFSPLVLCLSSNLAHTRQVLYHWVPAQPCSCTFERSHRSLIIVDFLSIISSSWWGQIGGYLSFVLILRWGLVYLGLASNSVCIQGWS